MWPAWFGWLPIGKLALWMNLINSTGLFALAKSRHQNQHQSRCILLELLPTKMKAITFHLRIFTVISMSTFGWNSQINKIPEKMSEIIPNKSSFMRKVRIVGTIVIWRWMANGDDLMEFGCLRYFAFGIARQDVSHERWSIDDDDDDDDDAVDDEKIKQTNMSTGNFRNKMYFWGDNADGNDRLWFIGSRCQSFELFSN